MTLLNKINPLQYDLRRQLRACESRSRRNGKVARLPAELRDQINRMLDDGILYKTIIKLLGDAGKHLNEDNIGNWRQGGYQDYLNSQLLTERARAQTEAAADIARETGHADAATLQKVCNEIALLQYFETLMEHGDQLAQDSLKNNPAKMITLMNTLCKMSHATITFEKNRDKTQRAAAADARTHPNPSEP
jgi:hypothetical protein